MKVVIVIFIITTAFVGWLATRVGRTTLPVGESFGQPPAPMSVPSPSLQHASGAQVKS